MISRMQITGKGTVLLASIVFIGDKLMNTYFIRVYSILNDNN